MTTLSFRFTIFIFLLGVSDIARALALHPAGFEQAWDSADWPRAGLVLTAMAGDGSGTIYVGGRDIGHHGFVAAYDANGNRQWKTSITSGSSLDNVSGIDIDLAGNILVAGTSIGTRYEPYIAKLSPQGQQLWGRQASSSDNALGYDVAVDSQGNVYLTGLTYGQIGEVSYGGLDAFVSKYDPDGSIVWAHQFDADVGALGQALAIDSSDDVLLVGRRAGTTGATLSKLTPDGDLIWNEYTNYSDTSGRGTQAAAVAVDGENNSYVVGATNMLLGTNATIVESDAVLAKHDSEGNLVWQRLIPGLPANRAAGITFDHAGDIVITGITDNTSFGEVRNLADSFLAGYSTDGEALWYQEFGTEFSDHSIDVHVDQERRLFVAGYHSDYIGPDYSDAGFIARFDRVPEPSTIVSLFPLATLGFLFRNWQHRIFQPSDTGKLSA